MNEDPPEERPAADRTPAHQFGTTMRIDLSPDLLGEAKRSAGLAEANRRPQQVIKLPKPAGVSLAQPPSEDVRQLLHSVYDGAFITELDGTIVMSNLRSHQFFAGDEKQLAQRNILTLICGAEEELLGTVFETLEKNRFVLMQAFCQRIDDTYFPAEISVNRIKLGGRDRLGFFVRDITLRKDQEERLRTGYTAIQNASSAIAITGLTGTIEYCNPAFLAFFLFTNDDEPQGRGLGDLLCEPEKVREITETVGRGETWESELELRRADESTFFGHVSISANVNTDGEQAGMVLSILDVSIQKQAQQQLEAYAEALSSQNAAMQDDLSIAGELHQALLPTDFLTFPRRADGTEEMVRFRHLYCPSGTIGGDFFDIREVSEHEVAVVIADVMGHGIRSALVVATIRGLLEDLRDYAHDPGALLTQLNSNYTKIFQQMGSDVTFSTALFGIFDTRTGLLRYANASHPRPYLVTGEEVGAIRPHGESGSAALGLFSESQYQTHEHQLHPGETILFYTDGLSEIENGEGELYDDHRFGALLRAHRQQAPEELLSALLADAREYGGSENFEDDVCVLAMQVRRKGARPSG